jgi:hypothetical protein
MHYVLLAFGVAPLYKLRGGSFILYIINYWLSFDFIWRQFYFLVISISEFHEILNGFFPWQVWILLLSLGGDSDAVDIDSASCQLIFKFHLIAFKVVDIKGKTAMEIGIFLTRGLINFFSLGEQRGNIYLSCSWNWILLIFHNKLILQWTLHVKLFDVWFTRGGTRYVFIIWRNSRSLRLRHWLSPWTNP